MSYLIRSLASGVRYGGRFNFPFNIFSIVFFLQIGLMKVGQCCFSLEGAHLFSAVKGGAPVSMSYMRAPRDHQSTALPCPVLVRISGAMYSMVPQKVWVTVLSSMDSLHKPKSVSLT